MTRKPLFWVLFALLSSLGAVFAFRFFPRAYPIVNLDLRMDRGTALHQAEQLARQHHWGPDRARAAASFDLDDEVQTFVELEGGGREAFLGMMSQGLYAPYTWSVRHFQEFTPTETTVFFTPQGQTYGFKEKLPEREAGSALPAESARAIAERAATQDWAIRLSDYHLVESSKEVRPSGRVDHVFTYERPQTIGAGRYRLRLEISGDRLTEVRHLVKVPEAFTRRYQQMRSANTTIASVGMLSMAVLYIIGGCILGSLLLIKRRALVWRPALAWGLVIGVLQGLLVLNTLPLEWMHYDTAVSARGFLTQQCLQAFAEALLEGLLLCVTFMAAEGLTRLAFPNHIQLWKLWDRRSAASPQVAGRTLGGYLAVGLFLAYDVAIYLFFSKALHWWTPSEALFDPNILATYLPWLSPLAQSLHAGFWEECLFRAIPLAGAALIGQKLGWKRSWLLGAFLIQALIFGSAHANYPNQPAYARIVELIIPSIAFGLIYLNWGLLPGIILHFIFDAVLMSIPLFVSAAPGIWISRTLVIALTLVPLWVLIYRRTQSKGGTELNELVFNRAWTPAPEVSRQEEAQPEPAPSEGTPRRAWFTRISLLAGALGVAIWLLATPFHSDAPRMSLTRGQAEAVARQELGRHAITLDSQWRTLSTVNSNQDLADTFIWRTAGRKVYRALLGSYVTAPHWTIRFVRFTGEVSERAEEYTVCVAPQGQAYRFVHALPEARAGQNLDRDQAKLLADAAVRTQFQLEPSHLQEVSATPKHLPARTDWTFTYADTESYRQDQGQARIDVTLAGGMVTDAKRYIHVPEEWERQEQNRQTLAQIIKGFSLLGVALICLTGIVLALVAWSRKCFSPKIFFGTAAALLGLKLLKVMLQWPSLIAHFETSKPFGPQVLLAIAAPLLGLLFASAGLGLMAGFAHGRLARSQKAPLFPWTALAWGVLGAGLVGLVHQAVGVKLEAHWPSFDALTAWLPALTAALSALDRFLQLTILWLLLMASLDWLGRGRKQARIPSLLLLALLGFLLAGVSAAASLALWLAVGLALALFLVLGQLLVLDDAPTAVPAIVAGFSILSLAATAIQHPHPGATLGALLGIALVALGAWYWNRRLNT